MTDRNTTNAEAGAWALVAILAAIAALIVWQAGLGGVPTVVLLVLAGGSLAVALWITSGVE